MTNNVLRLKASKLVHERGRPRRGRAHRPQVVSLETRSLMAVNPLAGPVDFDFVKDVTPGATEPIQVSREKYTDARGYGWTTLTNGMALGSLVVARAGTFSVALPNGDYNVTAAVGGSITRFGIQMEAEGQAVPQSVSASGATSPTVTFQTHVSDGVLDIKIVGPNNGGELFVLDKIEIQSIAPAQPPTDTGKPANDNTVAQAIALWRSQMLQYGRKEADWLIANQDGPLDPALAATYYDAARVFYQIADDTGDPYWLGVAKVAVKIYRDRYVLPNNGGVPGYWNFAEGLAEDYRRTGDVASRNAVMLLSQNAAYANDATPLEWTAGADHSREVAYALSAQLEAESLGAARRPRTALLAEQAMGHIDQWTAPPESRDPTMLVNPFMVGLTAEALIDYWNLYQDPRVLPKITQALDWIWANTWDSASQAFRYTDIDTTTLPHAENPTAQATVAPNGGGTLGGSLAVGTYTVSYTVVTAVGETLVSPPSAPFTVTAGSIPQVTLPAVPAGALSLSVYLTRVGDSVGASLYASNVTTTTFNLQADAKANAQAPPTTSTATTGLYNTGGTEPAPDLNQLIAPAYAWVYQRTGDLSYRDKADAIFAGGVKGAWLDGAKQFNQSYRWSFDYVKWRSAPPGTF